MESADCLLAEELEALQGLYAGVCGASMSNPLSVCLDIEPRQDSTAGQAFVKLRLMVHFSSQYPNQAPIIEAQDSRGLGDDRLAATLSQVQTEATALVGDLMLVQIYEAGRDALSLRNEPEGDCALCLEPLAAEQPGGLELPARLPCYHCIHRPCFQRWWHWEQIERQRLRDEVISERGATAGGELRGLNLIPDESGYFPVLCPTCRELHSPNALAESAPGLMCSPIDTSITSAAEDRGFRLSPEEMELLQQKQRQNLGALERQRQQGGLVDSSYAIPLQSLSLAKDKRPNSAAHASTSTVDALEPILTASSMRRSPHAGAQTQAAGQAASQATRRPDATYQADGWAELRGGPSGARAGGRGYRPGGLGVNSQEQLGVGRGPGPRGGGRGRRGGKVSRGHSSQHFAGRGSMEVRTAT